MQEILTQFAELKPLLKKSNSSLATALMGREKPGATGHGNGGSTASSTGEQQEVGILARIQRLYMLAAEAKVHIYSMFGGLLS